MRIIGMIARAPTSAKPWLCGGADAVQMDTSGGMIAGQMLMPRPLYPRKTSASDSTKGPAAGMPLTRRISSKPAAATSSGTGKNQNILGRLNQRCAICGCASGVQALSTAMTASSASVRGRAISHMWRCSRPSVFMISQVQPSSA
ncbi:hypothetical protein D3C78_1428790 [compost metagenome]